MILNIFKRIGKILAKFLFPDADIQEAEVASTYRHYPSSDLIVQAMRLLSAYQSDSERILDRESSIDPLRTRLWISSKNRQDGTAELGISCEVSYRDDEIYALTKLIIVTKYYFYFVPGQSDVRHEVTVETIDMTGKVHGRYTSELSGRPAPNTENIEAAYGHTATDEDLHILISTLEHIHEFTERPQSES